MKNYPRKAFVLFNKYHSIEIGDSLGDLGMVNDLDVNIIIKIGFLNEDIEKRLNIYKSKFDVVITDDGPMDYVNKLLREISKEN